VSLPSARQKPEESGASQAGGGQAVVSGAVPTAREVDPMIGRVLDGRFTIESRLGAGSMGTVYKAKQHAMGRNVAIKILRSDRALDEGARARFLREARANSLLASPHTVTVFDFGQADDGDFFLAMELLEGESLGDRLKREKRIAPEAAVEVVRQALRSLAEAHAKGIIHRDLKPDNLFFANVLTTDENGARRHDEAVKVVDFGIAKMLGTDNSPMNAIETQAGTVFGTPRYMSPEQAQGKTLDARSDLYSLGVILYHMLTGRPPFTDDDAIVVMARHIKTPPKRPIEAAPQAGIPIELENVVMRVLGKEPYHRPASAEAFSQELARAMNLSAVATSGIRVPGLSSAPPPPLIAFVQAPVFPPPPPVPSVLLPHIPPAPLSDGSLSTLPSSTASLEIAAGLRVGKRRWAVVTVASVLAVGAVALIVLGSAAPVRSPAMVQHEAPPPSPRPSSNVPIPPPPRPSFPLPAETAAAAPASTIPSTSFADLPRSAPTEPAHPARPTAPPRSTPRHEPTKPAPTPATTASGHYGLFE
jgi:eukaryotic-like serine/threonine-protein kinase